MHRIALGSLSAFRANRILVGAPAADIPVQDTGRAYLFDAVSGVLIHTFDNPSPNINDDFGRAVSVSVDRVLVGARSDGSEASRAGRAYLFDAVSGNLEHTFTNPTPAVDDFYGDAVSVSGDLVLIGAQFDEPGKAYLYDAVTGSGLWWFTNPSHRNEWSVR